MKQLNIFWRFSRPHTIFGTIFSIVTLYLLAIAGQPAPALGGLVLSLTLLSGIACNIFIVGTNQYIDLELDKINKPDLPLAAGEMTKPTALKIIWISLLISLLVSFATSYVLGLLILLITLLGLLYSVPPIQLKRHHLPAALCITLVRGVLVNVGMFVHFRWTLFGVDPFSAVPDFLFPLTLIIVAFSVAIAWFKDLPDTLGDAKFNFKTLAVMYSRQTALIGGSAILIAAYLYTIYWSYTEHFSLFLYGHLLFLGLFLANFWTISLKNEATIKVFYLRFWGLFFLEYILFGVWSVW